MIRTGEQYKDSIRDNLVVTAGGMPGGGGVCRGEIVGGAFLCAGFHGSEFGFCRKRVR